jgi:hypothetical protein
VEAVRPSDNRVLYPAVRKRPDLFSLAHARAGIRAAYAAAPMLLEHRPHLVRLHPHCDRHLCCCGWGHRLASPTPSSTRRAAAGRQVEQARSSNGSTRISTSSTSRRRKLGSISSAGWRRGVRLAGLVRPRRSKRWNEFSAPIPKRRRCFCSRTAISCVATSRPIYRNS